MKQISVTLISIAVMLLAVGSIIRTQRDGNRIAAAEARIAQLEKEVAALRKLR